MPHEIVRTIESSDGKFRVEVFRRADGSYGYEVLEFVEEGAWVPRGGRISIGIFESATTALTEARERVDWLKTKL